MAIREGNVKIKKSFNGSTKIKKAFLGSSKLWSGASLVSYYDGSKLLGTIEVDEGLDVLHPNISTYKSGYTLVGWSNTRYGSTVTSLKATGEPMTVYAKYLPNALKVASGYLISQSWIVETWNTSYLSGDQSHVNSSYGAAIEKTTTFTLYKGYYSTAKAIFGGIDWNGTSKSFRLDGTDVYYDTEYSLTSGEHSIYTHVFPNDHYENRIVGIKSLILSNPTPWV